MFLVHPRCSELIWCTVLSQYGWRCGSLVRCQSLAGRLCLIYSWHVTTGWVKCLLWVNRPGQLSLPSLQGQ